MAAEFLVRLFTGLCFSTVIAVAGARRQALAPGGAVAAVVVGTTVFAFGGLAWAVPMVAFFTVGSALSAVGAQRKRALAAVAAKGSRRDGAQVLANGGVATALALLAGTTDHASCLFLAYIGVVAVVSADTWSTEVGSLSRRPPRLVTTLEEVQPGTSGGVTLLGVIAALAGGLWIGAVGWLAQYAVGNASQYSLLGLSVAGMVAGLVGSLVDSLLGATVQEVRWCPACRLATEARVHSCGAESLPDRGWAGVDNDVVNALASLAGVPCGLVASVLS